MRRSRIGASEVAALFGAQPAYAMSHYTLWQVKAGKIPEPDVTGDRPESGLKFEQAAAEWLAEKEGWEIRKCGYVLHSTIEGFGCSPDYEIMAVPSGLLEVKWTDWLIHKKQWGGEPPLHIALQLQAQLACTGKSWGVVGCVIGGNERAVYRYERRPKIIAEIERRVVEFWQSIREGREPPVDGSASTAAAIKELYPECLDEEPIDLRLDNELPELCESFQEAKALREQYAKAESEARNRILAKVGPYRTAYVNGFTVKRSVTKAKPDRLAEAGELIRGRAGSVRLTVSEFES
jgi:predicted phage-related endonuclease